MITLHPPPAYFQVIEVQAQAPAQPLQIAPGETQQVAPNATQREQLEVLPYDIGRYLPPTALWATIVVSVFPPTGSAAVYTPGYENTPVIFHGPKSSGEVRINGPKIYLHLEDGAASYSIEILNWREP